MRRTLGVLTAGAGHLVSGWRGYVGALLVSVGAGELGGLPVGLVVAGGLLLVQDAQE